MDELHLVGLTEDGEHLVLSTADGEQLRLPLDDRLVAAIRGEIARVGPLRVEPESQLRPAEIQARIRAGESAEAVALAGGIPLLRVRRYEGPVLAERAHVAEQARRTPVRRRGDGFVPLLGDIVEARMAERGLSPESLVWDSRRLEDGTWEISVTVRIPLGAADPAEPPRARWVFDPRRGMLAAVDDQARVLTDEAPQPAPRRPDDRAEDAAPSATPFRRLASVPPPAAVEQLPADLATVEQALSGPGAPRREAAAVGETPMPDPEPAREPGGDAPLPPAGPAAAPPAAASRRTAARATAKGRRASVPAWDDIVFGTRRPD